MEDQKPISDFLQNVKELTIAYLQQVSRIAHLARLEAQAAYRTLWFLLGLLFILASLLTAIIGFIFFSLFLVLIIYHLNPLLAAGLTTLCACATFMLGCFVAVQLRKKLFFPITRKHLSTLTPTRNSTHEHTATKN